jgi:hypothetical protein
MRTSLPRHRSTAVRCARVMATALALAASPALGQGYPWLLTAPRTIYAFSDGSSAEATLTIGTSAATGQWTLLAEFTPIPGEYIFATSIYGRFADGAFGGVDVGPEPSGLPWTFELGDDDLFTGLGPVPPGLARTFVPDQIVLGTAFLDPNIPPPDFPYTLTVESVTTIAAVPEPATLALTAGGLLALGRVAARRQLGRTRRR